ANPFFGRLPSADLEALEAAMIPSSAPAGTVVFQEGDRGDALYLVVSGSISVSRRDRRRVHVLEELGPGALFGTLALLLDGPRSATCTALVPTELAALPRASVTQLLHRSAAVSWAFQRALARQLARDLRGSDK